LLARHFPHLSRVDDWLEEGMVMEMGNQHAQAPVSEAAIIEGNTVHGLGLVHWLFFIVRELYCN
jgi:hypothetical protein